jgi:hypothetical protein
MDMTQPTLGPIFAEDPCQRCGERAAARVEMRGELVDLCACGGWRYV